MPKKYRANDEDVFVMAGVKSVYGMFRPIEESLRAGGYKGPIFADFDNELYKDMNVIDEEATRKKQEEENRRRGVNAKKVTPVYKSTDDFFLKVKDNFEMEDKGSMYMENNISMHKPYTKASEKEFRKYLKKYEDYIDLIIKNTPEDEYSEELAELKYHKTYIRMIKVFGSRELWEDRLGFVVNARGYDADMAGIKEIGKKQNGTTNREVWRIVHKNYPYSDYRDAFIKITNLACDYEENKEKYTYIEQIKYRDDYKKALKEYLSACKELEREPGYKEKYGKLHVRAQIIASLKEADGPAKNVDYEAIIKRVQEQEENGFEPDPKDKEIADMINAQVNDEYEKTKYNDAIDIYNSRYSSELSALGYTVNEKDFTGVRGNRAYYSEVEAQINALDMGWPIDELVHIQRIQIALRANFKPKSRHFTAEDIAKLNRLKVFYNDRIKDKPYPSTEEERQAFYSELYEVSQGIVDATRQEFMSLNDDEQMVTMEWTEFRDDIKRSMDKPLSFAERITLDHVQKDSEPEYTVEKINEVKDKINSKRFGHSNSKEIERLQKAIGDFETAFEASPESFTENNLPNISAENLKILEELRSSSSAYLMEKDKEKKLPADRSEMGKNRYEGARAAYHMADELLKQRDAWLENEAKKKKDAEIQRGRKEARAVLIDSDSFSGKSYLEQEIREAGGPEAYEALKREEASRAAEIQPSTDAEKFDRFIDDCMLTKEDPVTFEDEGYNKEMQQNRVDRLGNMLAAMELKDAGKPFDESAILRRSKEIRAIYALDSLKKSTDTVNGPEKLRNALLARFRATEIKRELEQSLYEVRKLSYKNTAEAQKKYQADVTELLNRKIPDNASIYTKNIINALKEIKNINTDDKTLVGINAYKIRKANVKLIDAINKSFTASSKMDINAYGPRFAMDSLAVLSTYTGCQAVTNRMLQRLNATVKDMEGKKPNINVAEFKNEYGIKNSKKVTRELKERAEAEGNIDERIRNFDARTGKENIKAINELLGFNPKVYGEFDREGTLLKKKGEDGKAPIDDLEPIANKFMAIGAVNNDERITNEEFVSLVFASLVSRELVGETNERYTEKDPLLKGLAQEELYQLNKGVNIYKLTADPVDKLNVFIPQFAGGRNKAKSVLQEYGKGNKEPLAHMIAQGIKDISDIVRDVFDEAIGPKLVCCAQYARNLYNMAKKDPELMKLAEKDGLKTEDILYIADKGEADSIGFSSDNKIHSIRKAGENDYQYKPNEKENVYIDKFISVLVKEEKTIIRLEVNKGKKFKKESRDLFRKTVKNYFLTNMGSEFTKDAGNIMSRFSDFSKDSIDAFNNACNEIDKIQDPNQRNTALSQTKNAFVAEVKDYFIQMYGFTDGYENALLTKYKRVLDNNKVPAEDRLDAALKAEGERLKGKENLSEQDGNALRLLEKYEGYMSVIDNLGIEAEFGANGRFMDYHNKIDSVIVTKYNKKCVLPSILNDKEKVKELREDIRNYIRDKGLMNKSFDQFVRDISSYGAAISSGNPNRIRLNKPLLDKLQDHKEERRELQRNNPVR